MRRALLGGCLVAAICVASVFGQQPDDFGKKGGRGGGRGGKGKSMPASGNRIHRHDGIMPSACMPMFMEMGGGDLQRGLNHMGELGWELVTVDGIFGQGRGHAYFKRPKTGRPLPEGEEGERGRRFLCRRYLQDGSWAWAGGSWYEHAPAKRDDCDHSLEE